MKDYFYLNPSKMIEVCVGATTVECQFMMMIMGYLSTRSTSVFINNSDSREYFRSLGNGKSPGRVSNILSSMVSKGMLKREAPGVFSLPENLYCNADVFENSDS